MLATQQFIPDRRFVGIWIRYDERKRTLLPFGMRDGDNSRFEYIGMCHQRIFEIDRRDPFAAAFDKVLCAVHDLHVAFRVYGCHVAGAKPPVHKCFGRALVIVVGIDDRRAAHLKLANAFPIPRLLLPIIADDAEIDVEYTPFVVDNQDVLALPDASATTRLTKSLSGV